VDFSLISIRDALVRAPSIADNDADFRASMKERLRALPYVRALFVIGRDGYILHDTDYPSTPHVSLADRPYFSAHRDDSQLGLYIGHPLQSRSVSTWFVSASRRIDSRDGKFEGIVVAAVEPLYFESFYRALSADNQMVVSLLLRDGTLLARSPEPSNEIGKSFSASEPFRSILIQHDRGVFWSTSPIDSKPRVLAFEALQEMPLVLVAGYSEDLVMKAWREHAIVVIIGAAVMILMLSLLTLASHRHFVRQQLEEARLARHRRLEMIGQLAGGFAHDIGNSLRIVRSTFARLQVELAANFRARDVISEADRALNSTGEMIDRLLTFARRQDLRVQATDVNLLITSFLPILIQAAGPLVRVNLEQSDTPTICLIDGVQLEASLLNLILNSRDAITESGTVTIRVGRWVDPRGSAWAEVVIEDDGIGMPKHVLERASDPFFTTKPPGKGHGLGLSQVFGFVQQSFGQIDITSLEHRGTKVIIRFPLIGANLMKETIKGAVVSPKVCNMMSNQGINTRVAYHNDEQIDQTAISMRNKLN
jgi:signal transduction histidine kinase